MQLPAMHSLLTAPGSTDNEGDSNPSSCNRVDEPQLVLAAAEKGRRAQYVKHLLQAAGGLCSSLYITAVTWMLCYRIFNMMQDHSSQQVHVFEARLAEMQAQLTAAQQVADKADAQSKQLLQEKEQQVRHHSTLYAWCL